MNNITQVTYLSILLRLWTFILIIFKHPEKLYFFPNKHQKVCLILRYIYDAFLLSGWLTVGGIRSTGVSGSLGIAQYVSEILQTDFDLEPIHGEARHLEKVPWTAGGDGASVIIDGCVYHMAHPIFQFGHQKELSKL